MTPARAALLSVLLAFTWEWTAVHLLYNSNWTALFVASDRRERPSEMAATEYVFPSSGGYDGQFYQIIAHDPLMRNHYDRYMDGGRLRYRRIFIPGLASLLSVFVPVDYAYIGIVLLLTGLGAFCLSRLAILAGEFEWWGVSFVLVPAAMTSIGIMTVDIGVSAAALAALLFARFEKWVWLWLTLAAAFLVRETGVLIAAGCVVWLLRNAKPRLAGIMSLSAIPALFWYAYVAAHARGDYSTAPIGFVKPYIATWYRPLPPGPLFALLRVASLVAVLAVLYSVGAALVEAVRDRFRSLAPVIGAMFALLALVMQDTSVWDDPFSCCRVFSPLLLARLVSGPARWRTAAIPLLLTLPAVGMEFLQGLVAWILR